MKDSTTASRKNNPGSGLQVPSYDAFVVDALKPNFANDPTYQKFLQSCLDMLTKSVQRLIAGEAPYITIPTAVSEPMAEQIALQFNDAGGWSAVVRWDAEEPYLEFRRQPID